MSDGNDCNGLRGLVTSFAGDDTAHKCRVLGLHLEEIYDGGAIGDKEMVKE